MLTKEQWAGDFAIDFKSRQAVGDGIATMMALILVMDCTCIGLWVRYELRHFCFVHISATGVHYYFGTVRPGSLLCSLFLLW